MRRHDEGDPSGAASGGEGTGRSGPTPKQIVIAILALVLLIFAAANFKSVEVNFLFFTTKARVVTVILVSALLGFGAGYVVGRPGRAERKRLREEDKD
jgi:uncharacterized integral membrane protein